VPFSISASALELRRQTPMTIFSDPCRPAERDDRAVAISSLFAADGIDLRSGNQRLVHEVGPLHSAASWQFALHDSFWMLRRRPSRPPLVRQYGWTGSLGPPIMRMTLPLLSAGGQLLALELTRNVLVEPT